MVLINIGTLSDEEIRYIAQQEDLDGWDTLSREELIESIEDLYGDDSGNPENQNFAHKFFNTLTGSESDFSVMPGVLPISSTYNETYIHLIPYKANWLYAFWEISENDAKTIGEDPSLLIQVKALKTKTEEENTYEINILPQDNSWSIELPWDNREYVLSLICRTIDKDIVLCSSEKYFKAPMYLAKHPEELQDLATYRLLVSSMELKDGSIVDNADVREILNNV